MSEPSKAAMRAAREIEDTFTATGYEAETMAAMSEIIDSQFADLVSVFQRMLLRFETVAPSDDGLCEVDVEILDAAKEALASVS